MEFIRPLANNDTINLLWCMFSGSYMMTSLYYLYGQLNTHLDLQVIPIQFTVKLLATVQLTLIQQL